MESIEHSLISKSLEVYTGFLIEGLDLSLVVEACDEGWWRAMFTLMVTVELRQLNWILPL